ncbi:DUF3857 domain-containing protein [Rhodanobacter denitrificans]|uniref:DUF3857 domain-containing protein n=1 Tax=Rhodanobacter denitrificans TaxID=666685 RepID=M4NH95_9GAMM|nr:DUF3857 domain-containing protein [Rhodanobacter denitrificans]AGG89003.1 hypothetical protein R2APBS1_1879 [Rhodanobacter denitrificans]UJJ53027.1 DUF3857 domain-containing protein [Rhodanobacter denitrificans]
MKCFSAPACALLATAMLLPLGAAAEDPHVMVVLDRASIQVSASGATVVDRTQIMKAMDAEGVRMLGTLTIPFNLARQSVDIKGASVVMPDQTMREVGAGDIATHPWPTPVAAPSYRDVQRKEIRFAGLQPGAVVSAHYVIRTDRPLLQGQGGYFQVVSRAFPIKELRFDVSAPAAMHLNVRVNNMRTDHQRIGGTEHWTMTADKVAPLVNVASTSTLLAKSPFVAIGRSADPRAVGVAYLGRIAPAERVTLELQQLADSIGENAIDPSVLVRRYYAWINAHIALVPVPLGLANDRPRAAQDILLSKYGTAEDRVILLQALMHAKELPSDLVFVPSLPVMWGDQLPLVPEFQDKLLLTVDNGQHVLDIGNPVLALGEYDPEDHGKFGIRIGPGGGVAPLQIPDATATTSNGGTATQLVMLADGSLQGSTTVAAYGDMAASARHDVFANDPIALRGLVSRNAPVGTQLAIVHTDDPLQPSNRFVINTTFTVPAYHGLTAYRMPIPRVVTGTRPMDAFAAQRGPGLCQRTVRSEETQLHWVLPVRVDVPRNVDLSVGAGLGRYQATYIYDDASRTLRVQRSVTLQANPVQCDPAQQAQLAKLAEAVRADIGATLTVTPVAVAAR